MQMVRLFIGLLALLTPLYAKQVEAGRCTRVIQGPDSEYIINICNKCQKVNIQRKRRGIAMPVMRTYNIQPRSKLPTPFKGVGRSRIKSEVPCRSSAKDTGRNSIPKNGARALLEKCVSLKALNSRDVALINRCASCRGVVVQRYARNGQMLGREVYIMKALSVISVEPKGAAKIQYLNDTPCPS